MNIIIINDNKCDAFSETKNLASKFNENNEYNLYDISDMCHYINDYNIPIYEVISNILFSKNNSIINIESLELLDNNTYLKYVINSTDTVVLNFNSDKFTSDDILVGESDFIIDIKNKISSRQKLREKRNELVVASKVLDARGLFLFGNKISKKSKLCLIPGPPNQPIYFSEFVKTLMTLNSDDFCKSVDGSDVVFVREYSPVHEIISKIFERGVGS